MRTDRTRIKEDYDPTNTRHSTWVDKMCELFISQQHRSDHDKILTNIDHFQIPRNSVPRANQIHESERINKNHISCECTSQMLLFATKIPYPKNPSRSIVNAIVAMPLREWIDSVREWIDPCSFLSSFCHFGPPPVGFWVHSQIWRRRQHVISIQHHYWLPPR